MTLSRRELLYGITGTLAAPLLLGRADAQVTPDIVEKIFRQNISMGKGLGLMSMVQAVRTLANAAERSDTTHDA